jgi:radical SAM protein with 4Fe4S-binding SPASM domain
MEVHELKQRIMNGEQFEKDYILNEFERCRSDEPVIFNIETTNACNMRCKMCPRTTMMTRKIETLDMDTFERIVSQVKPHSQQQWAAWQSFAEGKYGVDREGMGENHFFLHILPKVLILHGFGDPLLDRKMPERIKKLSEEGFETYFSCNPVNIDVEKNVEMFRNGLGYVKYSIDSVDDFVQKEIRGRASDFTQGYEKILRLLEEKDKRNYQTKIVITMIALEQAKGQEEFEKLKAAFEGTDVYIYLKSLDQQWYLDEQEQMNSIHWLEFCQFPWSSMTIKSNGEVAMCGQDYNNEIIFGDAKEESLYDIWNGQKYAEFREHHVRVEPKLRCTERCDMNMVGQLMQMPVPA